jgi:hypothetical protein
MAKDIRVILWNAPSIYDLLHGIVDKSHICIRDPSGALHDLDPPRSAKKNVALGSLFW